MFFGNGDENVVWWRGWIARRTHSRWLSRAIRAGARVPRIPTRRVDEGGFDADMATAEGRAWAREWWEHALASPDPD